MSTGMTMPQNEEQIVDPYGQDREIGTLLADSKRGEVRNTGAVAPRITADATFAEHGRYYQRDDLRSNQAPWSSMHSDRRTGYQMKRQATDACKKAQNKAAKYERAVTYRNALECKTGIRAGKLKIAASRPLKSSSGAGAIWHR